MVPPTEHEELQYRLKKSEPICLLLSEYSNGQSIVSSPGDWFNRQFPKQAEMYGPPILEATHFSVDLAEHIRPAALNEEFFAAVLKGDQELNHHVVFFNQESQFYFFDCRFGYYAPTTEEKLKTRLSQLLIACAAEMPGNVDIRPLFCELRSDENLRKIVKRAKSMLSVCPAFFSGSNGKKRLCGGEVVDPTEEPAYKLFVNDRLILQANELLTSIRLRSLHRILREPGIGGGGT